MIYRFLVGSFKCYPIVLIYSPSPSPLVVNTLLHSSPSFFFPLCSIDSTQVDTISCSSTGPCLRNCFNYPSTDHAIICSQYSYVNCSKYRTSLCSWTLSHTSSFLSSIVAYDMNSDVTLYDGSETLCTIVGKHPSYLQETIGPQYICIIFRSFTSLDSVIIKASFTLSTSTV